MNNFKPYLFHVTLEVYDSQVSAERELVLATFQAETIAIRYAFPTILRQEINYRETVGPAAAAAWCLADCGIQCSAA